MLLQEGITGITNVKIILKNNRTHTLVDNKNFKKICYDIQNKGILTVKKFDFSLIARNFYIAECEYIKQEIYILLNAYYPYIAYSSNGDQCNLEFIEIEKLENEFSKYYRVLQYIRDLF